ncbi:hypothetical protein Leryth_021449 [Lithospermum erythrorhizon]|nr:hypothetical protein Leryth_021449 [Lithospermum erythrorhizon]
MVIDYNIFIIHVVIASIDCGYSGEEYLDSKLIIWESDDDYIRHGDTKVVPSRNSVSTEMDTLRVFTTRKKNCYGINSVDQEGERILIRASFYYGNYDGKSSPPVFDLQFSGNEWLTVQTSMDTVISHEVIYVVQGYTPSVCVAQTKPGNFPFISAIEVRSLDAEMYSGIRQDRALFLRDRIAYGSDEIIRYADDSYDRLWIPGGGTGFLSVANEALYIDDTHDDYPPVKVLENAITPSREFGNITLSSFPTNNDSNKQFSVYLNLYFSEVRELDETTELRSFNIYIDDNLWTQESPVKPPYEDFHQYYGNITVTSNSTVKLVQTSDSTLPPLINALEWFFISDVLNNGTNSKDGIHFFSNSLLVLFLRYYIRVKFMVSE